MYHFRTGSFSCCWTESECDLIVPSASCSVGLVSESHDFIHPCESALILHHHRGAWRTQRDSPCFWFYYSGSVTHRLSDTRIYFPSKELPVLRALSLLQIAKHFFTLTQHYSLTPNEPSLVYFLATTTSAFL